MYQPVLCAKEIYKSAKINGLYNLAIIDNAQLRLGNNIADTGNGRIAGRLADSRNRYAAIIINIDFCACLLDNLADHLAAWPNDIPDFIHRNLESGDFRCRFCQTFARAGQNLAHLA